MSKFMTRGKFTPEAMEDFMSLRLGDTGDTVFWHGFGDITSFPGGEVVARVEGVDVGRLLSYDKENNRAEQLSRKFLFYKDPETGELLKDENGEVRVMTYFKFQHFKFHLDDGRMMFSCTQGDGVNNFELSGGVNSETHKLGGQTVYSTPFNLMKGPMKIWENYDFVSSPDGSGGMDYAGYWARVGEAPPWLGGGMCTMHSYFKRYDAFNTLPANLQDFMNEYVPLWKEAPKDLEEIANL
jgi:hypothetical protein